MGTLVDPRREQSKDLVTGALHDARDLAVAEVDKLKAEVHQVGDMAKIAGIGVALLVVAAILLGQAFALGLAAAGLPAYAAFGIVGVVALVIGIVVVKHRRGSPHEHAH